MSIKQIQVTGAFFSPKIRDSLTKKGFKKIGEGHNSIVMSWPGNPSVVLKVFSKEDWATRRYMEFCQKHQDQNPHLMRVHDLQFSNAHSGLYMAKLEKLGKPTPETDLAVEWLSSKVWGRSTGLVDSISKSRGFNPRKIQQLAQKLSPTLLPTLKLLLKNSPKGKASLDSTMDNIGMRGPVIVFLDPWSRPQALY